MNTTNASGGSDVPQSKKKQTSSAPAESAAGWIPKERAQEQNRALQDVMMASQSVIESMTKATEAIDSCTRLKVDPPLVDWPAALSPDEFLDGIRAWHASIIKRVNQHAEETDLVERK